MFFIGKKMIKKILLSILLVNSFSSNSFAEEKKSPDSDKPNIILGGFFDTEYNFPLGKDIFFDQRRIGVKLKGNFNKRLSFNTQVELEHGGLWDGNKDGELKVNKAFLDFKLFDWLGFRSGVLLLPLGNTNLLYDPSKRETTSLSLFSRYMVPAAWIEPGLGFFGEVSPTNTWKIKYDFYVTQGLTDDIDDEEGLKDSKPFLFNDNNNNKALSGKVSFIPFNNLEVGLSTYFCKFDKNNDKYLGMGVGDFKYTLGDLELLGEGSFVSITPAEVKDNNGKVVAIVKGPMFGYTLETRYRLRPEFLKMSFLGKDFEKPTITLFGRFDQTDGDMTILNQYDKLQGTIGFNYRPIESVAFKFEYQHNINTEALLKNDSTKQKLGNQLIGSVAVGF